MRLLSRTCLAFLLVLTAAPVWAQKPPDDGNPEYGILLLTIGGGPSWNEDIGALRSQVNAKVPAEVAFGFYVGVAQVREMQGAVRRLEARKVRKIVVVPLLINSASEAMDQAGYAFGITDKPPTREKPPQGFGGENAKGRSMGEGMKFTSDFSNPDTAEKTVHTKLPLVLTPAMDDHPMIADILLRRAQALSKEPARETVVLVACGPVDEGMNRVAWIETMRRLGQSIQEKGKFRAFEVATLRDNAPQDVKQKAASDLKALVQRDREGGGRVLVVPLLLARGGAEKRIPEALEGAFYAWNGKTLLPDPALSKWVLEMAAAGAKQPDMRKYK
jgi:sirohydrochlorin cobaltochelatase